MAADVPKKLSFVWKDGRIVVGGDTAGDIGPIGLQGSDSVKENT